MIGVLPAVATGAAAGAGLTLILAGARAAPVRLDAVLSRLDPATSGRDTSRPGTWEDTTGRWLMARLTWPGRATIPRADLALLGRTPEVFVVRKAAAALAGLVSFALMGAVLALAGMRLPWEAPTVAALAAGAAMFFVPDLDVRAEAARRREDFRYAWASYLQLVRLDRTGGAGTDDALESAAAAAGGWAFTRIRAALASARSAHQPLWQGLHSLGTEIGVPEVGEFAETIQVADSEGTQIAATLGAAADSMRERLQAGTRARANSRTATMIVPLTVLGLGFIFLMGFPPFYQLLSTAP
jgi:hypothetical protein